MGTLGNFPESVWYDPEAVANILSLHTVRKYYHVTYDSSVDGAFVITNEKGSQHRFAPTGSRLYAYHKQTDCGWIFLNTVKQNKTHYSDWACKDAAQACRIQNIIMCPSTREYQHLTAHNLLPNNPVRREDIDAAEKIFGTNVGSLKGKTVTRAGPSTQGDVRSVPDDIMQQFRKANLLVDIMYVNKYHS